MTHHLMQPTKYYLRRRNSVRLQYRRLYQPNVFERVHVDFSHFGLTKSFFAYGYDLEVRPDEYDYYDARVWGRYRINPASMWHNAWISTDYRKPVAVDAGGGFWQWAEWGAHGQYANIGVILRASDRLNFNARLDWGNHHQIGWAQTLNADSVGMAMRHNREFAQTLRAQYLFGPNSYLNLNLRHNWNRVHSLERFHLTETGQLQPTNAYADPNLNVNLFNMDLKFVWWFAPGRELNLLYRASLAKIDGAWDKKYLENLRGLQNEQSNQVVSLRLVYFLDYAEVVQNAKFKP